MSSEMLHTIAVSELELVPLSVLHRSIYISFNKLPYSLMAILQYVNMDSPGQWTTAAIGLMNSGGIRGSIDETLRNGSMYIDVKRNYSMYCESFLYYPV
jgi:hypothetical protein